MENWSARKKVLFSIAIMSLAYGIAWVNEVNYQEHGKIYPNDYSSKHCYAAVK